MENAKKKFWFLVSQVKIPFSTNHKDKTALAFIWVIAGLICCFFFWEAAETSGGSLAIALPKSFGKISMVLWAKSQHRHVVFASLFFLAEIFMLVVSVLGFFLIHVVYKKDPFLKDELFPYFEKASFIRRLILGWFTLFTAVPNKFWVNTGQSTITVFLLTAILYCLALAFPLCFFFYFAYLLLCVQSFLFGLAYECSETARKSVNWFVFGDTHEPFAAKYFYWFWGNMYKKVLEKLAPIAAGVAAMETSRQIENTRRDAFADEQTYKAANETETGFKTPKERADFFTDRQNEWVDKSGTVTKVVKITEETFSGMFK